MKDIFKNKYAVYFLAKYDYTCVHIQKSEILEYWLVSYYEALTLLNFEQDRNILNKAEQRIINRKNN